MAGNLFFLHVYTIFLLFVLKACDQINAGRRERAYDVTHAFKTCKQERTAAGSSVVGVLGHKRTNGHQ